MVHTYIWVCDVALIRRCFAVFTVAVVGDCSAFVNSGSRVPSAGQLYGSKTPPRHIYGMSNTRRPCHVTNQHSPPVAIRHVTFADESSSVVGGAYAGQSASRYGSSELSDVTSVTSGSYYIGEDPIQKPPISFLFVWVTAIKYNHCYCYCYY